VQLEPTDEQIALREAVRRFAEAETPLETVRSLYEHREGFCREWWREAARLGWTSLFIPEAQGGGTVSGRPASDAVIVSEEIGRLVSPGPFLPVNIVAATIARAGSDEQIASLLPGLAEGETFAAWAFAESGDRWSPRDFETTISVSGTEVTISGEKTYLEAAGVANHILVTGRGGGGLSQVLVPADAQGLRVVTGRSIDMTRRYARVILDRVRLPATALIGAPGSAQHDVEAQLQLALALQCSEMIGVAERVFETTIEYGRERFAFGRPIVSFQALKHRIADMALWIEGAKAVGEELTHAVDREAAEASTLASVAKVHIGRRCLDIVDDCVQITGGLGVTWEQDIHLYNRRAAVNRAMFGSPEFHRHRLLGLICPEAPSAETQEGAAP